ncbi:MAG TPA: metal-dependent transcriptional regulator [Firmicutes bacterium]|nr:metal-dependent transcriptional regulator [Bacillota bacterium]
MSVSMQNYLEEILNLSLRQDTVRVTDIAERLNLTKPSVAQALKQLREQGLIRQSHYGPVELTKKGRKCALVVRRRHEVLKSFLMEVLGLNHQVAERDACLMEHAVSSETIERLVNFLLEGGYCTGNFHLEENAQ